MKINVYNEKMERVLILDENFISCLWSEEYNGVGRFTVEVVATNEIRKKVKTDFFVGRPDRTSVMVIKSIEDKNSTIELSGFSAVYLLNDVGFAGTIAAENPIGKAIKAAYDSSNRISYLSVVDDGETPDLLNPITRGQLLDSTLSACEESDLGIRSVMSKSSIEIHFFKPDEQNTLVFSEMYGNAIIKSVINSTVSRKNAILCFYSDSSGNEKYVEIDESAGEEKRLLIEDADVERTDTDTDVSFLEKIQAYAKELLAQQKEVLSVNMTLNPSDYGKKYDLGDILTVILPSGQKVKARVVSVSEKCQNNKTTVTITVGTTTKIKG